MSVDAQRRIGRALGAPVPREALVALARDLRDGGVDQRTLYRLFERAAIANARDPVRHDLLLDVMDRIWSGPWAKGHALFDRELGPDGPHNR